MTQICHDLIVGDLGRDASIRLVETCATIERNLIQSHLSATDIFRDEYRLWTFELICNIVKLKSIESPRLPPELRDVDVLVGCGFDGHVLVENLASMLRERALAFNQPKQHTRIVIPCNTLAAYVPSKLAVLRSDGSVVDAAVVTPPSAVLNKLSTLAQPAIFLPLGTSDAIDAYERLSAEVEDVTFVCPSAGLVAAFQDLVLTSIASVVDPRLVAAIDEWAREELRGASREGDATVLVSGCTDVEIVGWQSSLRALAEWIVASAYGLSNVDLLPVANVG